MLLDVAVEGEAEAAQKEQGRKVLGDDRQDRNWQRPPAVTSGEIADDRGEEDAKKAAANLSSAIARAGGARANLRDIGKRLAAVRALAEPVVNFLAAEWASTSSHQIPLKLESSRLSWPYRTIEPTAAPK